MRLREREEFTTIHTEGAILPPDLLAKIREGDGDLEGLRPEEYHLDAGEKLNERVSRSWNRVVGAWATFRTQAERVKDDDPGTTVTRERWLLPLFEELGYGRLQTSKAHELNGKSYPISHEWGCAPIHLVGLNVSLDRRTAGVAGAARTSPHSLVQEFLNRSDDHLWAFLSNGLQLRILRDNASLTRQAYVELDMEAMMEGEVYADFALLWLLCHQSRVEGEKPEEFWLERWSQAAQEQGTRALEQLREGVESAISVLGAGYLAHPANLALKERLREGDLEPQEYYRQLLRTVYRLIFLFVAEDRELLFDPEAKQEKKTRYREQYSTARLRRLAERRRGTRHPDLYRGLCVVIEKLGSEEGCPELGLPGLGAFLWSEEAVADLDECQLANRDLLEVIRSLAFTEENRIRRAVDYKNLGPEELGSVYESLLELQPEMNVDAPTFELRVVGGSERKTTGSYYTPTSLIQCLLDSALDPVIEEALKEGDQEEALLNLKICDPATGSGHFLVAAAHRVARSLASVRTGDAEPSPEAQQTAVRDVIGRCIYGVDINPDAVELCKVNLWLEAIDPGKPLTFLDDQILCGNSLLGTTPALMEQGIPDEAFNPIEGDDNKFASSLKSQNKKERPKEDLLAQGIASAQSSMFADFEREERVNYALLQKEAIGIAETDDSSVKVVREKGEMYQALLGSDAYRHSKLLADAWCAAFVWYKTADAPESITEASYRKLASNPRLISIATKKEIERLAEQYQFFHWHLAFPGVFWLPEGEDEPENDLMGWSGGFDVVLGNPPWEKLKVQEKEWFAGRKDAIANAPNKAQRARLIEGLKIEDPHLLDMFLDSKRISEGMSHFSRTSNRYPLTSSGDINTFQLFAGLFRSLMNSSGFAGVILPSGIVTGDNTKFFFQDLVRDRAIKSIYDFENSGGIFQAVQRNVRFCLFTITAMTHDQFDMAAQIMKPEHLRDKNKHYSLTREDLYQINPNTRTCPMFVSSFDAKIITTVHQRFPILLFEDGDMRNPWKISFMRMFDSANDSDHFYTYEDLLAANSTQRKNTFICGKKEFVPLYESKLAHQYNHRSATFEGIPPSSRFGTHPATLEVLDKQLKNDEFVVLPRYWIDADLVKKRTEGVWEKNWLMGFRRTISAVADSRSVVFSVLPYAATSDSIFLLFSGANIGAICAFISLMNSFLMDFVVKQKASGGNLSYYIIKQLPVPYPNMITDEFIEFVVPRVLELIYTSKDISDFALDIGYSGPPFIWNEERRFHIRNELDAMVFQIYGISREHLSYILDHFTIVRDQDIQNYSEYRTKAGIIRCYDQIQKAAECGKPYQTILSPPPAALSVTHRYKEED